MSWDTLPKDNLEYLLSKLKTDVLDNKVDTEAGKGLSSNDYTTADKNKLAGIAANATKVESSETNGNIKIDTVETVVYDDAEIQEVIDTSSTETAYANPLSLETMQAQHAKNTKIKLDPIQDLHGYDKPWVGGAEKNLCNVVNRTNGLYNVTITSSSITEEIIANGTASGSGPQASDAYVLMSVLDAGTYNIKVFGDTQFPSSGSFLRILTDDPEVTVLENVRVNEDRSFTLSESKTLIGILRIQSGDVFNNFKIKVMISKDSINTWSPYSNICPISGHDEIKIDGCGKNLVKFDGLSDYRTAKTNKVYVNGQETFTLSLKSIVKAAGIVAKDKNDVTVGEKGYSNTKLVSYTIPDGTDYVICYVGTSDAITEEIFNSLEVQLELGSTATTYEPYQSSNDLSIDLPSTIYGGVLDLESGELVVTDVYKQFTFDAPTLKDEMNRWKVARLFNASDNVLSELINKNWAATTNYRFLCNKLEKKLETICVATDFSFAVYGHATYVELRLRIPDSYGTAEQVKALADSCAFTYPINPFTLYLSPEHLKLLKAQNNLTTSQYTQIKVTYRNGVFATLEELSDTAQDIYDEISGDATIVSGNPINFTTREKQKSKSTIIDLEPIQDLHGFTKPWVGGAGKNLLNPSLTAIKALNNSGGTWEGNVYTFRGVTYTVEATGDVVTSIKVNGTSSPGRSYFIVCNKSNTSLTSQSYILSSENTNIKVSIYNGSTSTYGVGELTFNYADMATNWNGTIYVDENATVTNQISKPMIRKSTDSAGFEPYENICPISGRTSVDVNGCGKNLIGLPGGWDNYGVLQPTASAIRSELIAAKQGDTYIASKSQAFTTAWEKVYVLLFDANNNFISQVILLDYGVTQGVIYTIPSNVSYIAFSLYLNATDLQNIDLYHVQVEKGSVCSLFEPYTPSTDLTISFGTTVYGGRLNVEKGELVVDKECKTDLGQLTWTQIATGTTGKYRFSAIFSPNGKQSDTDHLTSICSNYSLLAAGETYHRLQGYTVPASGNEILIYDASKDTLSSSDFKTAMSGVQFCYELATPTTIQLTPQQVQLLKDINNISTTGTTITVTFKNGSVAHLDDLPNFTDYDKEKLASIDTLAITLDLLTHTLIVTQDI